MGNAALTTVTTSLRRMLGSEQGRPGIGLIVWRGLEGLGILATLLAVWLSYDANQQAIAANELANAQLVLAERAFADQQNMSALNLLATKMMPRELAWPAAAGLVAAGIGVPSLPAGCRPGEEVESTEFGDKCTEVHDLTISGPGSDPTSIFGLAADLGRLTNVSISKVTFWGGSMTGALIIDSSMEAVTFNAVDLEGTVVSPDQREGSTEGIDGPDFIDSNLEGFRFTGDGFGRITINGSNVTGMGVTRAVVTNGSWGNYLYVREGQSYPTSVPFFVSDICPESTRPSVGWKPDIEKCESPEDLGIAIDPPEDDV